MKNFKKLKMIKLKENIKNIRTNDNLTLSQKKKKLKKHNKELKELEIKEEKKIFIIKKLSSSAMGDNILKTVILHENF